MRLFPSLVVFAVIVTGTFHAATGSAIPYGSLTELGNPTLSSYHNTLRHFLTYMKQKLAEKFSTTYWTHYAIHSPVPSFEEAKAAATRLIDVTTDEYNSLWNKEWENVKQGKIYVGDEPKRRAFVKVAAYLWSRHGKEDRNFIIGDFLDYGTRYFMTPQGIFRVFPRVFTPSAHLSDLMLWSTGVGLE
ncbi:hypothetical protein BC835DRAFT_1420622 [Cytidiella melzeri]|nr:hypothetical protein BC835DRAFT_1420622 [Cytidiella melzeri]